MNKVKEAKVKTFTKGKESLNAISYPYVLAGRNRKFENYTITKSGFILASNLIEYGEYYYNNTDILTSVVGLGKRFHHIFKEDLVNNTTCKTASTNDELEKIKFIDLSQELKNIKEMNYNKKLFNNNFVNNFISQDVINSHFDEIEPLIIEFCQKNGMPFLETDIQDTGKTIIHSNILKFCKENEILLFGKRVFWDKRILAYCEKQNTYFIDFSDVFTTGKVHINPLAVDFCKQNNIPYKPLQNLKVDSRVIEFCRQNNISKIFTSIGEVIHYCNIRPFIALSIIIYILFEAQDIVKQLIDFAYNPPTIEDSTLGYIVDSKQYGWNENSLEFRIYFKKLKSILWFFVNSKNINLKDFSLFSLCTNIQDYCIMLELETTYIQFLSTPRFFSSDRRFGIEEIHNNLISVAWSRLKTTIFSDNARICANPKCDRIFEPTKKSQKLCPTCEKEKVNLNINSQKYYNTHQELHKELVKLYNSIDSSKLKNIPKRTYDKIKKCITYTKSTEVKENTKKSDIKAYINLLNNLK